MNRSHKKLQNSRKLIHKTLVKDYSATGDHFMALVRSAKGLSNEHRRMLERMEIAEALGKPVPQRAHQAWMALKAIKLAQHASLGIDQLLIMISMVACGGGMFAIGVFGLSYEPGEMMQLGVT